jgi:DNA-binding protein
MMTSESLKAQGKSIKRAVLTGSLLREMLGLQPRTQSPDVCLPSIELI